MISVVIEEWWGSGVFNERSKFLLIIVRGELVGEVLKLIMILLVDMIKWFGFFHDRREILLVFLERFVELAWIHKEILVHIILSIFKTLNELPITEVTVINWLMTHFRYQRARRNSLHLSGAISSSKGSYEL